MHRLADVLPDDPTREELDALVVQRARTDSAFWDLLVNDPREALSQFFGRPLPDELEVQVHVEGEGTFYHVVPHPETSEVGAGPPELYPRSSFRGQVNYLLHNDPAFKQSFLEDPKLAVASSFEFRLPHHVDVVPLEETETLLHLVLPWEPHGAIFNAPFALEFDGKTGVVAIPYNANLKIAAELTVEAWVRAPSFHPGNWQDAVVSNHGPATGWELRVGGAIPRFMVTVDGVHYYAEPDSDAAILQPNAWYYLAGVYDGQRLAMYINGKLAYDRELTGLITQEEGPLTLGRNSNANWTDRFFAGQIDEVRIRGLALTPLDIARNRPRKRPLPPTADPRDELRIYFPMSEGTGQILVDHSGARNNGLLMGGVKWLATGISSAPRVG